MPHPEIALIFLFIALIYASVGFGGGSGYLAVLALYALPYPEMRLTALVCNIIVVTGGTLLFISKKELPYRKVLPLVITSVPAAFAGAILHISEHTFYMLLGCSLLAAGVTLWLRTAPETAKSEAPIKPNYLRDGLLGGGIGFLSGMVGIGGGIFLAPILHLLHWDTPRRIAATASFFILINSISGITGQLSTLPTGIDYSRIGILGLAVLIGGQIGSRVSSAKLSQLAVRRLTGILVFAAGAEVLLKHFK
jgi:uncharacterized membrane protein YfcA